MHVTNQLQNKFDELESMGVFVRPEDVPVSVEYLNPTFLVKKRNGAFRLVTAFTYVGRYSKQQPALMPEVDRTLETHNIHRSIQYFLSDSTVE